MDKIKAYLKANWKTFAFFGGVILLGLMVKYGITSGGVGLNG